MPNTFFSGNRAVYEIMRRINVQLYRSQMTLWRMRIAGWIPKATNTHSKYVIIIALPLQEKLHEHGSIKRHKHIACLVFTTLIGTAQSL